MPKQKQTKKIKEPEIEIVFEDCEAEILEFVEKVLIPEQQIPIIEI